MLSRNILRLALVADAVSSAALGVVCSAGAAPLSGLLGLPENLLRVAGMALIPWAVLAGLLARSGTPRPALVWGVVSVNAVWVLDSVGLLVAGNVEPTALGTAFVVVQAVAVAILAELQVIGLRQGRRLQPAVA